MLKKIAIIPARLQSQRLPKKLLLDLGGSPVIVRTYEAVKNTNLFDEVLVATDSKDIYQTVLQFDGKAVMSDQEHDCGSNRIAEAVEDLDYDIVVNVQGDEPFTNKEDLQRLLEVFDDDEQNEIALASLMHTLSEERDIENPNNVKVIVDTYCNAMYFSRSPIPFIRDESATAEVYKHVGIYAFRKDALMDFYKSKPTPLELAEKIEAIRHLEYGKKIRMVETSNHTIGIDTATDLEKARNYWERWAQLHR
ncbi:3-deoxy-manno-octulosonate cytidylyltransferase (CMP-KDO synthetase) [Nonlabens sp. Hel1_33_55]|uniref:3-deoxy-manno-octulosonate cytidylyltransferase n=1 Tax=Nonlabens sp. Hel1_33_55 TaxID=1336802 RepID=UPI000875CDD6|nr:3-deoxy-manno-octulosonate cytidylyltransferase [Nonlabens sp. Hel1_33_55]SCX96222.1 3-deoxy-manno-octulosonate cytidylyltransferase (CMP-KDO synthetase) [Nonlabens sp. Hel1_33_55]